MLKAFMTAALLLGSVGAAQAEGTWTLDTSATSVEANDWDDRDRDRDRDRDGRRPGRRWAGHGTSCGPHQPWGVSLRCPNTSPNGGPIGMSCGNYQRGTQCFGARYWNSNFVCTDPNTGQNAHGSYIFNMYICR